MYLYIIYKTNTNLYFSDFVLGKVWNDYFSTEYDKCGIYKFNW